MLKIKHSINSIKQPNQAYTRQQMYDSDTNSLNNSTVWSPTNTIVENMSSAATLTSRDESSLNKKSSFIPVTSGWLHQRQKNNKRNRVMLGCIGLVVFMVLMGTVVLWIGSAFILPQKKYSSTLAQVPRSSSYTFNHHNHPTSTSSSPSKHHKSPIHSH